MTDGGSEPACPECGRNSVEAHGLTASFYPSRRIDRTDRRRGRRVIERRFRCRECGHEFSEVEESER